MQQTVLVIDPDRAGLREIAMHWQDQPWQTITAHTLEEAIDLLDEKAIDMIIAVEDLGWMNGYEFLRLTHHRYPRMIRILIINDSPAASRKSFSPYFHAEDHFHIVASKPYSSESMTAIVREMFGLGESEAYHATDNVQSHFRF